VQLLSVKPVHHDARVAQQEPVVEPHEVGLLGVVLDGLIAHPHEPRHIDLKILRAALCGLERALDARQALVGLARALGQARELALELGQLLLEGLDLLRAGLPLEALL
jgi:hypothetical protein